MLVVTSNSFAQKKDSITTIEISYGYGMQCFPKKGIYSRSEKYVFEKSKMNTFYLTKFCKYWSKWRGKDKYTKDSLVRVLKKEVNYLLCENLINEIRVDKKDSAFNYLKTKIIVPSNKKIKALFRKNDAYYKMECDGMFDCSYRNEELEKAKKFDRFEEYVNLELLKNNAPLVIGYWNDCEVVLKSKTSNDKYRLSFKEKSFGQPSFKLDADDSKKIEYKTNFKVNEIIEKLAEKNSITQKVFKFDSLFENYFLWYYKIDFEESMKSLELELKKDNK